ncbi:MAG TPA: SRPBCC family protein [Nocardioidaceae bacterium]|nr:SRPBCC family protein [Nocardioidaceae bacterium]
MAPREISASTTVEAPPSVVFSILSDPRQHARIDGSGSVGNVIDGPDRLRAKGDQFSVHMKIVVPYKITNKVVEYEQDRRIAWRHFGAHRWRYELEPTDDGGTTVTETFDYSRYPDLGARILKLTGSLERNRRGIEETLVRLKRAAEQDAAQRA